MTISICQEKKGFKIEKNEHQVFSENFQNCKSYGENISASFISYSNTECYYSKEPFVQIVRDIPSSYFIYKIYDVETNTDTIFLLLRLILLTRLQMYKYI